MALFSKPDVHEDAVVFEAPKPSEIPIGSQFVSKAVFVEKISTLDGTLELPDSTRSCSAPYASTGNSINLKAAESPIRPDQETGLSVHALQDLNDSTTSVCVNKDDAKSCHKANGKREASGTTGNDPGQGRPLKRARSDCTTAQRHDDFYILDANTVVEVDGVLFKLHRSRLVSKSLFFAQLLEHNDKDNLPNDDVRVENDGKVTVYHLGNTTTADDFVALLKFDDNPTEYYFQPPPFSALAPILRAATALRFETYRVWADRVLRQTWSSSLADLTPDRKENAAEVIVLARSCDVNSGVKRALYELARTRRIGLHDNDVLGQSGLGQIGHADQKCVELMRELLVTTWSEIAVRVGMSSCQEDYARKVNPSSSWGKKGKSSAPRETCSFKSGTEHATWNNRVHDSGLHTKFLFDAVCGAQALIDIPWGEEDWCSDCIQTKRATWRKIRQNLWSDMDKWIPGNK
ncbi:hypothetical protein EDB19DRAFT_81733 [Suillus lakei]|nr:hypothetical protein EDB19DRAFT_81733 [Suillus lakei]